MNKKRYSLMLMNMDRSMHMAYKKMTKPSANNMMSKGSLYQNVKGRNSTQNLQTSNSRMRQTAYEDFLVLRNQSLYPFGLTEQRFKWQNLDDKSNPINPNDYRIRLKRIPVKNSFEEGLGSFLTKGNNKNLVKNKSEGYLNPYREKNYGRTSQRVILPEKNEEKVPRKGKKCQINRSFCEGSAFGGSRNSRNKGLQKSASTGSITYLIDKTPLEFPHKGKKRFEKANDFRGTINIFSDEYNKAISTTISKNHKRMHYNDVIC